MFRCDAKSCGCPIYFFEIKRLVFSLWHSREKTDTKVRRTISCLNWRQCRQVIKLARAVRRHDLDSCCWNIGRRVRSRLSKRRGRRRHKGLLYWRRRHIGCLPWLVLRRRHGSGRRCCNACRKPGEQKCNDQRQQQKHNRGSFVGRHPKVVAENCSGIRRMRQFARFAKDGSGIRRMRSSARFAKDGSGQAPSGARERCLTTTFTSKCKVPS